MWWLLGLLCFALVGWGISSARRILYPERFPIVPPQSLPSHLSQILITPEGEPFEVWLLETPTPRGRVLLCHGYYANRYQVLGIAQGLRERGYEALLFELRGHGVRPGPCTLGFKEVHDAQLVLRWARFRSPFTAQLPVGVVGLSMGAAVACQVAFHSSEIRAVIVDSIYPRLFPILQRAIWQRYHVPRVPFAWFSWWSVQLALGHRLALIDPVILAPQLHQPLLAIQGGEDQRVSPTRGWEFYERWAGRKERWLDPAVGHVKMFSQHPQEYCNRVATFFDRAFT